MDRHRLAVAVAAAFVVALVGPTAVSFFNPLVSKAPVLESAQSPALAPAPVTLPGLTLSHEQPAQIVIRFELAPGLMLTGRYRLEPETVAEAESFKACCCDNTVPLIDQ